MYPAAQPAQNRRSRESGDGLQLLADHAHRPAQRTSGNHVATEQKRRDRINKGFDDLRALIQVDGKLDKAAFLAAVVDYVKRVQGVLGEVLAGSGGATRGRAGSSGDCQPSSGACAGIGASLGADLQQVLQLGQALQLQQAAGSLAMPPLMLWSGPAFGLEQCDRSMAARPPRQAHAPSRYVAEDSPPAARKRKKPPADAAASQAQTKREASPTPRQLDTWAQTALEQLAQAAECESGSDSEGSAGAGACSGSREGLRKRRAGSRPGLANRAADEDDGEAEETRRRLESNREAARRCRERKMNYTKQLEEKVEELQDELRAALTAQTAPTPDRRTHPKPGTKPGTKPEPKPEPELDFGGDDENDNDWVPPPPPRPRAPPAKAAHRPEAEPRDEAEAPAAAASAAGRRVRVAVAVNATAAAAMDREEDSEAWQAPYREAARAVRGALAACASEAQLRAAALGALAALQSEAAQRREAATGGDLAAVARGAFLSPAQRLLLFMGGLRPSTVLSAASAQLKAGGDNKGAGSLASLAARCRPEEAGLEAAMNAALLQLAAQAGGHGEEGPVKLPGAALKPLRAALGRADDLRLSLYDQLPALLRARELAAVALAPLCLLDGAEAALGNAPSGCVRF
ncbi:hypothetical protein WJX81_007452 [Elliptochloris bilobata]|uniref:BHLH domain-containing protein n=1 Tax=Elliptochloris bilobata TaxID=381761 RepID=A0AAW1QHT9_9CHLO